MTGFSYLLSLLCLFTKWEVTGWWEEEQWCNQWQGGWSKGEEDLEQCSKALERLRGCDEWAGPQSDNWLCPALRDGRKLVTVTHRRSCRWVIQWVAKRVCEPGCQGDVGKWHWAQGPGLSTLVLGGEEGRGH